MRIFNQGKCSYLVVAFLFFLLNACQSLKPSYVSDKPIDQQTIVKSPNDNREYASITLPNQLELVLVSDPGIEKSAAALSVGVGSYQEPKNFGGLAHYLEHMVFMGTKSYPEVGGYHDFVSRNGGTQNAYTDLQHTNYMVAVNSDVFEQALARFSGFFHEAKLDQAYAEKERNAVHSEWTMKAPNDWVILEQLNGLTLNPEHPVSQFNWGNLESLKDSKTQTLHQAMVDFYHKYYSANLMKGALISSLPITDMKRLAKKYFSKIPNKHIVLPPLPDVTTSTKHLKKIVHYQPQTEMKQIQMKFVIKNNASQFAVKPNGYVNYLLVNEMPGSLASELRNAGLSEAVYADFDASLYGSYGDLTLYIDLTEDGLNNRDRVMAAVLKYLDLLKSQGVNAKYFKEIKQSLQNEFRFKEQTNDFDYAMQIAANLQKFSAEYVLSHGYEYQRFNPIAIQQVLDQLSLKNARVFYIDKNQPTHQDMKFFAGKYAETTISEQQEQRWRALTDEFALHLPRNNKLMPSHFDLAPARYLDKPQQIVNQHGYTAHLGHSIAFRQPKGRLKLELNTGFGKSSAKNHVLSNLLTKALVQALTELQSEAIIAGMELDVEVSNGLSISLGGFTHRQPELLARALHIVNNLEVTQSDLLNHIASFESGILSSKKQILLNQLFPKFRQVLNLDNFSDEALLNELHTITSSQLIKFKQQLLQQARLRVFAFGNYTSEQVKGLGKLALDVLPKPRKISDYYLSPELEVSAGDIVTWQEEVSIEDVAFADTYMARLTVKDLATAHVLNEIINPAVFKRIRTEEQLAYTVGFFSQRIKEQLLLGYYIQSPAMGLADVQQRMKSFRLSFSKTLPKLTSSEFNDYKSSLLATLQQPAKNLIEEYAQLITDWRLNNWQFDSKENLIQHVKNVTLNDVVALYQKIESNKSFGRLLVQLKGKNFVDKPYIEPNGASIIQDLEKFHISQLIKTAK